MPYSQSLQRGARHGSQRSLQVELLSMQAVGGFCLLVYLVF